MTQFKDKVQRQEILLLAEEWAKGINWMGNFDLDKQHLDFNYPQKRQLGHCRVTSYNSGVYKTENIKTGEVNYFGENLSGDALIDKYMFGQ